MASARTTTRRRRRRLGASVATVLAVTVGAGVLAAPGATAAPISAASAASDEAKLPVDAQIASAGSTGHLTSRQDDSGNTVLEWHRYADGSVHPVASGPGVVGHDSNSDFAVTSDGSLVHVRDMRTNGSWSTSFGLWSEFKAGATLVGVVGENLFVSVPTTGDYHELWQLSRANAVNKKSKLSSRARNIDYKVIASSGYGFLVVGSERKYADRPEIQYWSATSNVNSGSVLDWGGSGGMSRWTRSTTGAFTPAYKAWVHHPLEGPAEILVSDGQRFPLDASLSGAVIAGIVGDVILHGVIAGGAAGDLVARDAAGVLWLHQGNGAGNFAPRVKIGAGWNGFSQLVGGGDVTADGRPDLIAYGPGGTYVYASTGSATAPFVRRTTSLYAGEGSKFTSVA